MPRKTIPSRRRPGSAKLRRVSPLRLRLKEVRNAHGLTQQALAAQAGVSQSTIARIESGSLRNVTLDLIERLAEGLGVSPQSLIESAPAEKPKRR